MAGSLSAQVATQPFEHIARNASAKAPTDVAAGVIGVAVMRGVNAAMVGLLGAALDNPVWTTSVKGPGDFGLALIGFVLLTAWEAPPPLVVAVTAAGGIVLAIAGLH
jgi:chromate transport protein ChrA